MLSHYYTQRLRYIFRFRTKHGYGVHSPYMFNLIMNVLRKQKRYQYPYINTNLNKKEKKLLQISYRIINSFKPEKIFALGNLNDILKNYITISDVIFDLSQIENCSFIWINQRSCKETDAADIIATVLKWCNEYPHRHAVFITDINKNCFQATVWKSLKSCAKIQIEMMWYGLLIFDDKLQAGKYSLTP